MCGLCFLGAAMHYSIFQAGSNVIQRCTTCCKLYHCPICPKLKPFSDRRIRQHLEVHVKHGIKFKDKMICRCNSNCRAAGHYHCPLCHRTVIRRHDMEVHLELCEKVTQKKSSSPEHTDHTDPAPALASSSSSSVTDPVCPPLGEDLKQLVHSSSPSVPDPVYPPLGKDLKQLVQYIYIHKKIPTNPENDLLRPKALTDFTTDLHPAETTCSFCPGSVELRTSTRISDNARIVTMAGLVENVSTYFRACPRCHMVYRYQEWKDGLHNFNDHVILTLELCLHLRNSLQRNVSVSQVMNSLENPKTVKHLSANTVLQAYCHFEALTSHVYSFSCICCGLSPPVVTMDLHKRRVFDSPGCDMDESSENRSSGMILEEFWDSVQMEIISRGFSPSPVHNNFVSNPRFERWGPWMNDGEALNDSLTET